MVYDFPIYGSRKNEALQLEYGDFHFGGFGQLLLAFLPVVQVLQLLCKHTFAVTLHQRTILVDAQISDNEIFVYLIPGKHTQTP